MSVIFSISKVLTIINNDEEKNLHLFPEIDILCVSSLYHYLEISTFVPLL